MAFTSDKGDGGRRASQRRHLTPSSGAKRGSRHGTMARYNGRACCTQGGERGRPAGSSVAVTERDSKRIIRQWDREIEDEIRRDAGRAPADRLPRAVIRVAASIA